MKSRQSDLLKLETVKTMSTPRKINAILLNMILNRPKLISLCGYKLATNWQNFAKIYLALVKILEKVLGGGATFLTHTTYAYLYSLNICSTRLIRVD